MASFIKELDRAMRQACLSLSVNGCKDIQSICLERFLKLPLSFCIGSAHLLTLAAARATDIDLIICDIG